MAYSNVLQFPIIESERGTSFRYFSTPTIEGVFKYASSIFYQREHKISELPLRFLEAIYKLGSEDVKNSLTSMLLNEDLIQEAVKTWEDDNEHFDMNIETRHHIEYLTCYTWINDLEPSGCFLYGSYLLAKELSLAFRGKQTQLFKERSFLEIRKKHMKENNQEKLQLLSNLPPFYGMS